jgi:hypothetical protein
MNEDRRILAWLAVLVSMLCCAPLACGAGFLVLAGGVTYLDPEGYWEVSDTFLLAVLSGIAVAAVVIGLVLAAWGVRSLLKRASGSSQ